MQDQNLPNRAAHYSGGLTLAQAIRLPQRPSPYPGIPGKGAQTAYYKKLVLSHLTPITEPRLDEVQQLIRAQGYSGRISVARDLKVYNLDE